MSTLPYAIDVTDDLERARETAETDVDEDVRTIEDRLAAYENRDRADPEGVLEEVENQLLRLETRTDGEAAERFASARGRVQAYRDVRRRGPSDLVVLDAQIQEGSADDGGIGAGRVAVRLVVANEGDARTVTPHVDFVDDDGTLLEEETVEAVALDAGEQTTRTVHVRAPDGAAAFDVHFTESNAE